MGFVVTPLGTFLEGTEHLAAQEIEAIRPQAVAEAKAEEAVVEKKAETEVESFREEIVTKVGDLLNEVEGK